jgi:hypothetical protein
VARGPQSDRAYQRPGSGWREDRIHKRSRSGRRSPRLGSPPRSRGTSLRSRLTYTVGFRSGHLIRSSSEATATSSPATSATPNPKAWAPTAGSLMATPQGRPRHLAANRPPWSPAVHGRRGRPAAPAFTAAPSNATSAAAQPHTHGTGPGSPTSHANSQALGSRKAVTQRLAIRSLSSPSSSEWDRNSPQSGRYIRLSRFYACARCMS